MKKWTYRPPEDEVVIETGAYVEATTGPVPGGRTGKRIFQAVELGWADTKHGFLSDAASQWGRAPWALFPAKKAMGLRKIGFLQDAAKEFGVWFEYAQMASCKGTGDGLPADSGLMLVRTAAALAEKASRGLPCDARSAEVELAEERKRDSRSKTERESAFMAAFPDWK